jgi:hypothetical protein
MPISVTVNGDDGERLKITTPQAGITNGELNATLNSYL